MRNLEGKVAVVTGAGSGIGRATALTMARHGMVVALCDINEAAARAAADEARSAGGSASAHGADVSSEEDMRRLVKDVLTTHDVVDVVVNNAGISPDMTAAVDQSLETFSRMMEVNFWGVVHGSLFFLPHLLERPEASLVNVASNASLMAYSRLAPYVASKFATRGFTESLRMELRSTPVRVTLVCPGVTTTNLVRNSPLIGEERREALQRNVEEGWGRPPEKVAAAIIRAIRHKRARLLTGPDSVAMDLIVRAMPGGYSRVLRPGVEKMLDRVSGEPSNP